MQLKDLLSWEWFVREFRQLCHVGPGKSLQPFRSSEPWGSYCQFVVANHLMFRRPRVRLLCFSDSNESVEARQSANLSRCRGLGLVYDEVPDCQATAVVSYLICG
jgi:hypothetical protein